MSWRKMKIHTFFFKTGLKEMSFEPKDTPVTQPGFQKIMSLHV